VRTKAANRLAVVLQAEAICFSTRREKAAD
jgi:hypothetical protein